MPDRILTAIFAFFDTVVTIITVIALIGFAEVVSIAAGSLAILFWIPRIKREIDTFHGGSFISYLRSVFKRKK